MNLKTGTVEGEADMETVLCAFSSFVLYWIRVGGVMWRMSSGVDVENERAVWMWRMSERSWMWRISDEDIYLRSAKKILLCIFVLY